jgi:hypothetical protein
MTGQSLRSISQVQGRLSDKNISYELKSLESNYLISFCSLATSVHDLPYVANTFIRKSIFPILLRVLVSLYDKLEIDLEV